MSTKNLTIIFLVHLIFICNNIWAQDFVSEIIREINMYSDKIDSLIIEGEYYHAVQESESMKYGLILLYGLYLDEKLIPRELDGYKLNIESSSNEMDGQNITLYREYIKQKDDTPLINNSVLTLVISNNDKVIDQIANVNAFEFNLIDEEDQKYKPIKIEGFKALLVFDKKRKISSIAIALTNSTTVKINIEGNEDFYEVISIANLVNYKKIVELLP